ncbi:MAG: hypothetical protein GY749_31655 [Desulfobacteraceae bacterium]|nr:hypothetical protein [Desulfobacteraceae bacterium]
MPVFIPVILNILGIPVQTAVHLQGLSVSELGLMGILGIAGISFIILLILQIPHNPSSDK